MLVGKFAGRERNEDFTTKVISIFAFYESLPFQHLTFSWMRQVTTSFFR